MNPYVCETYCSICGGPGVSTPRDAAAEWTGAQLTHTNPETCRYYLEKKRREEKEAQEDKAAQARAQFDADDEYMFEQYEESKHEA